MCEYVNGKYVWADTVKLLVRLKTFLIKSTKRHTVDSSAVIKDILFFLHFL
jgi:hypothetical protein